MSSPRCLIIPLFLISSSLSTAAEPETRMFSPSKYQADDSVPGKAPIFPGALNGKRSLAEAVDTPPERDVDKSALFCFPDSSGYFGTVGDGSHSVVRYGFGLETRASADVNNVVDGVKGTIEHLLITTVFSPICGGDGESSGIHGLYFSPEVQEQPDRLRSVTCSEENICNVYGCTVLVYGEHELDIPQIISDSIEASAEPRAGEMFDDVVRVFYVNLGGGNSNVRSGSASDEGGLSTGAIVAIVLCSILVVVGFIGLIVYRRRRRANASIPNDALQPASLSVIPATGEPYLAFSVEDANASF